jgi:hypothetical protein
MEKEWSIQVTGPHCGTVTFPGFTWDEAQAEADRLRSNRHARVVEIVRS